MGSCYDSHLCSVLGSLLMLPPSLSRNSALCCNSFLLIQINFRAPGLQDGRRGSPCRVAALEVFHLTPCLPPASVHFVLPPSDSPSHYTLLLHEARAIDPSDNPVFHIGRLILTLSPGADVWPILQVLEHAEYESWSLIYILLVPLSLEELPEKHSLKSEEVIVVCQFSSSSTVCMKPHAS